MTTRTIENYVILDGHAVEVATAHEFRNAVRVARRWSNANNEVCYLYKQTKTLQIQSQIYPDPKRRDEDY